VKRWFIFDEIPIGHPAFLYPVTRFESSADSKPCDRAGENRGQQDRHHESKKECRPAALTLPPQIL
jgi:hypothetical protein